MRSYSIEYRAATYRRLVKNRHLHAEQLRAPDHSNAMELLTYSPSAQLAHYVEYFWTMQCLRDAVLPMQMFANGTSGIIVQHRNGNSVLRRSNGLQRCNSADPPNVFVYGKRTRPGQLIARGPFELTGVVFRPQALQTLLKVDPSHVNNGPVNVDDVLPTKIADRLLNAGSAAERRTLLARGLGALVVDACDDDPVVALSLSLVQRHVCTIRIPQLLKELMVSERQLERRFTRAIGVSPHQYLRILRFQEAVRLLRAGRFDRFSDLACELNYVDQSHFAKDTREFSGYSPTGLSATVRGAVAMPCSLILATPQQLAA
jgi:AraC-like DNA-binding protein